MFNRGPTWGLAGFVLGAALSATAGNAFKFSSSTPPSAQNSAAEVSVNAAAIVSTFPQRVVLTTVGSDELEAAIQDFPIGVRPKIRQDVTSGKYGLLWLTAWDWDTAPGEDANTISILSNDYRRYIQLSGSRTRYALPEPRSGSIELRGDVTEDGNISISVLSGTQSIALPRMALGQSVKLNIDKQERRVAGGRAKGSADVPSIDRYTSD